MRVAFVGSAARRAAACTVLVVTLGAVAPARAQSVGDPVADADLVVVGPPRPFLELSVTEAAIAAAAPLGGATLFASASAGGPVIARVAKGPRAPGSSADWPDFEFAGIPDGTYHVVLVYGIVDTPTVPASAWRRLDFGTSCAGAPGRTVLTPTVSGTTVTLGFSAPSGAGCPPDYQQLEVGSAPGRRDILDIVSPSALFATSGVPPGDYYLRAYGVNRFGRGPTSLEMPIRVPADGCVAPPVPQNVVATTGPGSVALSWTLPPSPGPAVAFHEVRAFQVQPGGGLTDLGFFSLPAGTAFATAVPAGAYQVFLRSATPCGKSTFAAGASFTVP